MNFSNYIYIYFFLLLSCSDSKVSNNLVVNLDSSKENTYHVYIQEGKLDSAKLYIENLYKEHPNDKDILVKRGEIHFLLNQFEISEISWLQCLSIDETYGICYEKLLGLYCGIYDPMGTDCNDMIIKALSLNKNNKVAIYFKAKRFVEKGKINEAINLYEELLKNDTKNLRVLNDLAILYDTSYKSEFYYKKILEIDSNHIAFYGLGMHFQKKGLFKESIENYRKSISVKKNKESYYNMGYCFLMIDLVNKAIDSFSNAIEMDGSYLEAYFGRAHAYNILNKKNLAIEDFKFCLMLEPGYEPARVELEKIK